MSETATRSIRCRPPHRRRADRRRGRRLLPGGPGLGPVDWRWEVIEAESPDQFAALWPDPQKVTELLRLARRREFRNGLELLVDGLDESRFLNRPMTAKQRRAIRALILACARMK